MPSDPFYSIEEIPDVPEDQPWSSEDAAAWLLTLAEEDRLITLGRWAAELDRLDEELRCLLIDLGGSYRRLAQEPIVDKRNALADRIEHCCRVLADQLRRASKNDPHDGPAPEDETRMTQPVPGPAAWVGDDPILREWLEGLPLWDQLADRSAFIREALFWKDAQPLLDRIRQAFPGLDEESPERVAHHSIQLVSCVLCVHHPRRWERCDVCKRNGDSRDPRYPRCKECRGDGFTITRRKWGEAPST